MANPQWRMGTLGLKEFAKQKYLVKETLDIV